MLFMYGATYNIFIEVNFVLEKYICINECHIRFSLGSTVALTDVDKPVYLRFGYTTGVCNPVNHTLDLISARSFHLNHISGGDKFGSAEEDVSITKHASRLVALELIYNLYFVIGLSYSPNNDIIMLFKLWQIDSHIFKNIWPRITGITVIITGYQGRIILYIYRVSPIIAYQEGLSIVFLGFVASTCSIMLVELSTQVYYHFFIHFMRDPFLFIMSCCSLSNKN